MLEILACFSANGAKKGKNGRAIIPNSMRKGFALAFNKFDGYSLAKYRGEGKSIKLIDLVNAVRPTPTEKNSEAIKKLVKGELVSTETWEAKLTKAGQIAETEEELSNLKKEAWKDLIENRKIKYFALLRNLRNILTQAPELVETACELLVDEKSIKKSLVLPFRYVTAKNEIEKINDSKARKIVKAINSAVDIACSNVPKFDGETLVVLDVSGSMTSANNPNTNMSCAKIGSLFSAVLLKANDCDFMTFDGSARYVNVNTNDSVLTIADSIKCTGGSTDFNSIFRTANKKYDRIIILSDMQGWVEGGAHRQTFQDYKNNYKANPYIYSFDLHGYGSTQFIGSKVFALAGFSEKVFDSMKLMEQDKEALYNEIMKIEL